MRKIRCLVVDDERYAREELIYLLGEFARIEVVGEADNGEAALVKAVQYLPDVVFLDIEMPKMNGIEVAKGLKELKEAPLIIFATAYPEFAVEAFRINALDYLLKPYHTEQLAQTVMRIETDLHISSSPEQEQAEQPGRLAVESEGEIDYVLVDTILYMFREGKLTKIVTKENTYEVRLTLKELEKRLEKYAFFRIHKSFIINLKDVRRLTPWFNGAYHVELAGVTEKLSVSRNYVKELRNRLEL